MKAAALLSNQHVGSEQLTIPNTGHSPIYCTNGNYNHKTGIRYANSQFYATDRLQRCPISYINTIKTVFYLKKGYKK